MKKRIIAILTAATLGIAFLLSAGTETAQAAITTKKSYTIKVDNSNGALKGYMGTGTYQKGKQFIIKAVMKPGRTFKGWYIKNPDGTYSRTRFAQDFKTRADRSLTLVANTDFYIDCDLNGGQGVDERITYNLESQAITLGTPSKAGHTFAGWKDANGNVSMEVTIPKHSCGDKKYQAQWNAETYKVTIIL